MDLFTFAAIAFFIYKVFSKKDKPPQRMPRRPEGYNQPQTTNPEVREAQARPQKNRKESIFENLERQIRESAERFERELSGKPSTPPPRTAKRKQDDRAAMEREDDQGVEGAWGSEGRSEYDTYRTSEGTSDYDRYQTTEGSSDYDTYTTTEGVGTEDLVERQRKAKQKTQRTPEQISPRPEDALVSPTQRPVLTNQERMAGIFGASRSPLVEGIIWAEVLKEPKGKRALMHRDR